MRLIAGSGARFVVTTGDNNYQNGTQTEYGDLDHSGALTQPPLGPGLGGVFARRNWAQVGASMPIFPVIGNHDINEDQTHNTPTCPTSKIDPGTPPSSSTGRRTAR